MSIFECKIKDKSNNQIKTVGRMEIKNLVNNKAQLFFYGDIVNDSWSSYYYDEDKCPQDILDFLSELDGSRELEIYVNSGGGSVHGGLAIYHQLKRYQGKKTAYIDGIAGSIASIIPFACDTVIIYKSAQVMIHKPWCGLYGNSDDLRKQADALDSCQEAITNIYMENVKDGITREYITELINAETYLTGEKAKEVFNVFVEESETQIVNSIYYSNYKNKPLNTVDFKEFNMGEKEKLQLELEILSA